MIANYDQVRPQLLIKQNLQVTSAPAVPRMAALVIGPLYRPVYADIEGMAPTTAFNAAGQTLSWTVMSGAVSAALPSTQTAEPTSAKLYGKGLEAVLASFNAATTANSKIFIPDLTKPHIVRMGTVGAHNHFNGASLSGVLAGRPVKVGDLVYVTGSTDVAGYTTTKARKVVALIGENSAATYGTSATFNDSLAANVAANPSAQGAQAVTAVSVPAGWGTVFATVPGTFAGNLQGATYQGKHGDLFTLTVVTGGAAGTATVNLSSASGLFSGSALATSSESGGFRVAGIAGTNVRLTPPGGTTTLTPGQVFTFSILGAYARLAFPTNLALSGTYTGTKDTTYRIRVVTGTTGNTATGGVVEISDTSGLEEVSQITLTNAAVAAMGTRGISLAIDLATAPVAQGGLRKGDVYMVHARAATASTVNFDALQLDAPAVDLGAFTGAGGSTTTALGFETRLGYTGFISAVGSGASVAWSASASGVTVSPSLALRVPERTGGEWVPFKTLVGTLSLSYRALVARDLTNGYEVIDSLSDITSKLAGVDYTDPQTELAFGVWRAFSAAQGRRVYAVNTGGVTPTAFSAALARLKHSSEFVYFGGLTDDPAVRLLVEAHCDEMSRPGIQKVRSVYFGVDSPGEYTYVSTDPATGNAPTALISADGTGAFKLLSHTSSTLDFVALGVTAGDLVRLTVSGTTYTVAAVVNSQEVLLVSGPGSAVTVAEPFALVKPDTVAAQSDALIQAAKGLSNRRAKLCWAERGTRIGNNGLVEVVPSRFLGCEVAGLASAIPPQRPLTRVEVETITNAPNMHLRYEPEDLDLIASNGVMVIAQDVPGGPVYIRHQLTTETDKGSLYYEDTPTRVLDYLTLRAADTFSPWYGKQNINKRNRSLNEARWLQLLDEASKAPTEAGTDDPDGPIIAGYRDASVTVHPTLKDRFVFKATVAVQLPGNTFEIDITGEIAEVTA